MEGCVIHDQKKTKQKTKTTIYKMKHVFDKTNIPNKEKNKVIAKVKKVIS